MGSPTVRSVRWEDHFDRAQVLSTTPGHNGWTIKDTSSAGTPTYLGTSGAGLKLTMANNSEAEIVTLFQNDVLQVPLSSLEYVAWVLKIAGWDANTQLVAGVASAQADAADDITNNAWFLLTGATPAAFAETDDGTTDLDDKSAGGATGAGWVRYEIDFTAGLSNIKFKKDGQDVATTTTFSMAAAAGNNVQPFLQLQKASGTGVGTVSIRLFEMQYSIQLI